MKNVGTASTVQALVVVALVLGLGLAAPAAPRVDTLRFVWFTDGPDMLAIEGLVADFEARNPDVRVDLAVVPFAELNTILTAQAEAGRAPDLARVTEPPRFSRWALDLRPHLRERDFGKNFLDDSAGVVTGPNGEVYGFHHDFTLNAPFINMSLVKRAGLRLPAKDRVSWKEWFDLARQVKERTGVPFAAAVDRSGHRLDGIIQAMGGGFFTPDGRDVRVNSPANLQAISYFVQLHKDGVMPLEVWAGGGGGYADARALFVNNQLVFYVSGNWQMAFFRDTIRDRFEWQVVDNACEVQCGGMPGGKFLIGFKDTRAPDKVARLIEYLGSRVSMRHFSVQSLFLPTRKDLIAEGIRYPARNEDMATFIRGISRLPRSSYVDAFHPRFGPVATEVRDRVTQAIVGQFSVERALELAQTRARELMR
jgi:alpha-1,4-digalacturonate transport system substrate-binding protein